MAQNCKECGKRLSILPSRDFCPDCEFTLYPDGKPVTPSKFCNQCGATLEHSLFGEGYCPRCREVEKQKAEQDRIRAEYDRVRVASFNSQGEYNGWLQRAGPSIEIIDTTASPRRGLLYSGTIHKTTFTVTYKLRKPTQPAQPQVAAPMPPQRPPAIDIPEQIEKLGKLKEHGLLTEDEFQSKKQELLSRL